VATAANGQSGAGGDCESSDGCGDAGISIPCIAIELDLAAPATDDAGPSMGGHVDAHTDSANEAEKERSDRSAATRRKRRLMLRS
jgi:hypothetical protein